MSSHNENFSPPEEEDILTLLLREADEADRLGLLEPPEIIYLPLEDEED